MTFVHPTARIEHSARIADDVEIGPYCVIGPDVTIAGGCRLIAQVHVTGHTTIGERTVVYPFASLGTPPQSLSYRGGPTKLVIGADCDIREGVTMNTGTEDGGGVTEVGDHGLFMVNVHIGHDCHVGDHANFANSATLGGHCVVGGYVVIGGLTAVHQHTRIGDYAMIGGMTGLRSDVIPFGLANGLYAQLSGINVVGMKRRGYSRPSIHAARQAYTKLFFGDGTFASRVEKVDAELGSDDAVRQIMAFIRDSRDRSLCRPSDAPQD
jgi:UDP-N-acetylglucosamine acyltransferase